MKPGELGKLVRDFVPECVLFGPLREWYDSNCYRIFESRNDDPQGLYRASKSLIILRRDDVIGYEFKPILVVNGYSTMIHNGKRTGFYNVSLCRIFGGFEHSPTGMILSPGVKLIKAPQEVIKSYLEEYYQSVLTVNEVSVDAIKEASRFYKDASGSL